VEDGKWILSKYFALKLCEDRSVKIHFNTECHPAIAALITREFGFLKAKNISIGQSYILDEDDALVDFTDDGCDPLFNKPVAP